eukprot:Plantae.Rhodophyta-Purpureofilum_apyrenoidigerum.ctg11629.p1 GENE.Plantae.Rhodophyta-Purpureofilum_apyrenoidigerum.ctg11629~~Plantae.Rhodophyta-Purpureofilum_apyrenoidigerum.ctg11629.p1  ORF type:complete len:577 (+),score=127.26 Plantae.Rhodophyta-Purpureofilum_apyrenoidigerum.ctg11629:56-1732(+)
MVTLPKQLCLENEEMRISPKAQFAFVLSAGCRLGRQPLRLQRTPKRLRHHGAKMCVAQQKNQKDLDVITPRSENYSEWYLDIVRTADLAENSPVRGMMIIKPNGMAAWESTRDYLDAKIKESGAKNVYFPLFIPQSFLTKEAEHVEGFAKECALVTHHRLRLNPETNKMEPDPDAELDEPLVVRPTSETIIWHMFGKWISSYRDLPLCINQWANVVRWEMRTRLFLRTSEFLWQEGHTAHESAEDASRKAKEMIDIYEDLCVNHLALPVVKGVKSPSERFAGAEETYTVEAMMQNGWALQSGTSHFLGQNFAKAFDVKFQTAKEGQSDYVWATSWGVSTRLMGALIMTHSDDAGFVCPPRVAPTQIVIVCIWKKADQKEAVLDAAYEIKNRLKGKYRVEIDAREGIRPGAKYYEWERKGVPLRMEIGPRDVQNRSAFCAKRTGGQKFGVSMDESFESTVDEVLESMQSELYDKAAKRLADNTISISSYTEMRDALSNNEAKFFLAPWKDDAENEEKVKDECKATIRCYPLEGQHEASEKKCFYSGEPATHMAIFAKAY